MEYWSQITSENNGNTSQNHKLFYVFDKWWWWCGFEWLRRCNYPTSGFCPGRLFNLGLCEGLRFSVSGLGWLLPVDRLLPGPFDKGFLKSLTMGGPVFDLSFETWSEFMDCDNKSATEKENSKIEGHAWFIQITIWKLPFSTWFDQCSLSIRVIKITIYGFISAISVWDFFPIHQKISFANIHWYYRTQVFLIINHSILSLAYKHWVGVCPNWVRV